MSNQGPTTSSAFWGYALREKVHNLGLLMVMQLLRHAGAVAKIVEEDKTLEDLIILVRKFAPDLVCFSCTMTECVPSAIEMTMALKGEFAKLTILAGARPVCGTSPKCFKPDVMQCVAVKKKHAMLCANL